MNSTVLLANGSLRCELAPDLGASIAGLWCNRVPVLRSVAAAQLADASQSGCFPLVPFSNRIGQATLVWNGARHALERNLSPEPHAIHGVGWSRAWQVREASDTVAVLAFEHLPDASWPFAFVCTQTFTLGPAALDITLSGTNSSDQPVPFGLGWHPFFEKRPDSHIRFQAGGRWEMGPDKLPTHRSRCTGLDQSCAGLAVDHCFDRWYGPVELRDAWLLTRITSSLGHLVVYTNDHQGFVAIEPVSHVNNAINMADGDPHRLGELGIAILQPGETLSASMRIETGPTP